MSKSARHRTSVSATRFMSDFHPDVIVPAGASDQMIYLLADRFLAQGALMDLKVTRPDMVACLVTFRSMEREAVAELEMEALHS
jgi:hypothetical protein